MKKIFLAGITMSMVTTTSFAQDKIDEKVSRLLKNWNIMMGVSENVSQSLQDVIRENLVLHDKADKYDACLKVDVCKKAIEEAGRPPTKKP